MAKFSDRIFGNNVHPDVIKIFDNSQEGAQKLGLTGTDLNYYYSSFNNLYSFLT